MSNQTVLVLGAYGLAGRAIVEDLAKDTPYQIRAAGRNEEKLRKVKDVSATDRIETRTVDVRDAQELRMACDGASLVINAVGPYSRFGTDAARAALESGLPYIDCANEQDHYQRLQQLDSDARQRDLPIVTAAGAVPGCSTMLVADLLERFPAATEVDCYWAHLRLPHADSGLGSVMGGILEVGNSPVAMTGGRLTPVVVGKSVKTATLPEPFGKRLMVEVPTIDSLVLPDRHNLREFHSWFYFGDLPVWLLGIIRRLQPHRRPIVYRMIERIVRHLNERDTNKAIASGVGPEGLLVATARNHSEERTSYIVFRDGARATSQLPVLIARKFLEGDRNRSGLLTPIDLFRPDEVLTKLGSAVVRASYASRSSSAD